MVVRLEQHHLFPLSVPGIMTGTILSISRAKITKSISTTSCTSLEQRCHVIRERESRLTR